MCRYVPQHHNAYNTINHIRTPYTGHCCGRVRGTCLCTRDFQAHNSPHNSWVCAHGCCTCRTIPVHLCGSCSFNCLPPCHKRCVCGVVGVGGGSCILSIVCARVEGERGCAQEVVLLMQIRTPPYCPSCIHHVPLIFTLHYTSYTTHIHLMYTSQTPHVHLMYTSYTHLHLYTSPPPPGHPPTRGSW